MGWTRWTTRNTFSFAKTGLAGCFTELKLLNWSLAIGRLFGAVTKVVHVHQNWLDPKQV
jgi:hypothetical protein